MNIVSKQIEPVHADRFAMNDIILIDVSVSYLFENSLICDIHICNIIMVTAPEMTIDTICKATSRDMLTCFNFEKPLSEELSAMVFCSSKI